MSTLSVSSASAGVSINVPTLSYTSGSSFGVLAPAASSVKVQVSVFNETLVSNSKSANSAGRVASASAQTIKKDASYYDTAGKSRAGAGSVSGSTYDSGTKGSGGTSSGSSGNQENKTSSAPLRDGTAYNSPGPKKDTSAHPGRPIFVDIKEATVEGSTLRVRARLGPSDIFPRRSPLVARVQSRTPGFVQSESTDPRDRKKDPAPFTVKFDVFFASLTQEEYDKLKEENPDQPLYFETIVETNIDSRDLERLDNCYEFELYVAGGSGGEFTKVKPRETKKALICPQLSIGGFRVFSYDFRPRRGRYDSFFAVASLQGTEWIQWRHQQLEDHEVDSQDDYINNYMDGHVFNTRVAPNMPFGAGAAVRSGFFGGTFPASSDPYFDFYWLSPPAPVDNPGASEPSIVVTIDTPFDAAYGYINDYLVLPLGGENAVLVWYWHYRSFWRYTYAIYGVMITPGKEEIFAEYGYVLPGDTTDIPPLFGFEATAILEGQPFVMDSLENNYTTFNSGAIEISSGSFTPDGDIKCIVVNGSEIMEIAPPNGLYEKLRNMYTPFDGGPTPEPRTFSNRIQGMLGSAMWINGKYAPYERTSFNPGMPALGVPPSYLEEGARPLVGPFRQLEINREIYLGGDAIYTLYGVFNQVDVSRYAGRILGENGGVTYDIYDSFLGGNFKFSDKQSRHGRVFDYPFLRANPSGIYANSLFYNYNATGPGVGYWYLNSLPSGPGPGESEEDARRLYSSYYDAPNYNVWLDSAENPNDPYALQPNTMYFKTSLENGETISLKTRIGRLIAKPPLPDGTKEFPDPGGTPHVFTDWGKPTVCRNVVRRYGFDTEAYPFLFFINLDQIPDNSYYVSIRNLGSSPGESPGSYSGVATVNMTGSSYNAHLITWGEDAKENLLIRNYLIKTVLKDEVPNNISVKVSQAPSSVKPERGLSQEMQLRLESGNRRVCKFNLIYGYAILSSVNKRSTVIDQLQEIDGQLQSPGVIKYLSW